MYPNIYPKSELYEGTMLSNSVSGSFSSSQSTFPESFIQQLDGNITLSSSIISVSSSEAYSPDNPHVYELECPAVNSIPVILSNRQSTIYPKKHNDGREPRFLKIVKRSTKCL